MASKSSIGLPLLAAACIIGGYVALAARHLSLGPLLLVGGYCLLLPAFLWRSFQGQGGE